MMRGPEDYIDIVESQKRYYMIIDFEATCWAGEERRGDAEIIEFGCIKVARRSGRILGEFGRFVRPVRYPTLSDYCVKLTGITQDDVDAAGEFPEVLEEFVAWLGDSSEYSFCSWGAYDLFLLRQACRFHRVPYPFDDEYINIKPHFSEIVSGRGVSLVRAMQMLDLPFVGRLHRGIDDARNIAKVWQVLLRGIY